MNAKSHDIRQIAQDLYPGYDQLEPLGHGGMGELFKGRKTGLDVPVVVKIIKPKLKGVLDERQEAEILKGLKHKYLPRVYDVIESQDGYLYTIMDYIPGENLKEYVRRNGAVDQKTAYRWACQLCEVVAYLHSQNPAIIHSDIKPGNVMITPEGDICLIDFNTSMELRAGLTAIGKTRGYAAPEQYTRPDQAEDSADGTVVDQNGEGTLLSEVSSTGRTDNSEKSSESSNRSSWFFRSFAAASGKGEKREYYGTVTKQTDVYSIGATLYFILTGTVPAHSLEPIKPLSAYHLPISRAMTQIIERAMEKHGENRFRDAAEMGRALAEIHRLEGSYRKARLLTAVGVGLEIALLVGGISLMAAGSARMAQERSDSYVQLLNQAQQEKGKGNYAQALDLTDQAQELVYTRMEAYTEEAAVYYDQGIHAVGKAQREEAFQQCVNTVQQILKGDYTGGTAQEWNKAYFVGAESCVELERYSLAQNWYQKGIDHFPTESGYRGLICAYAFGGKLEEAKAALAQMQEALPETDTQATAALIQAELACLEGDYAGAVVHYKTLFRSTQEEALLRRAYLAANNACVYGGNEYVPQAIAFLEEACQRLPGAWGIYKPMLASAYYTQAYLAPQEEREGWLEKALDAFEEVLPEYLSREDRLAMNQIRIEQRQLDEAEADLLEMKELYPDSYRVHMRLSHLYLARYAGTYRMQYRTQAEEAYRLARELYEESGELDTEMIVFMNSWQQYVKEEGDAS